MQWIAAIIGSAVLGIAPAPTVAPPSAPGAWHQLGAAMTSRPGKALHFYRTALNPQALSIVVTSASTSSIRLFWWNYCEFQSDDEITGEHQAVVSGVGSVTVYPPVFGGATQCYVAVNATPTGKATVSAAVFES